MIVEINTDHLIKMDLTAGQYLLAFLIYQRLYNAYSNLKFNFPQIIENDLQMLNDKGFIFQTGTRMGYSITDKYLEYCGNKDRFDELLERYPVFVIRPDGNKDFLRTDKKGNRRKYESLTNRSKSKHEHILKCLEFEIKTREREGSLKYMKRLNNWLTDREWEIWAERMEVDTQTELKTTTYGTELV
jgi:hypothetical protein